MAYVRKERFCYEIEGADPLKGGKRCYRKEAKRDARVKWTKLVLEAMGLKDKVRVTTSTE